ncbi:DUF2089 family protein [Neofamilia massiliensis]|uniref:DUF2089 family protein n=1 Tax=Neofamilia massiliensis TaxID=1673724 RepID=UPI0006BB5A17|nr:DUF2089 family protein [Neofamilia massiliensis]
MNIEFIPPWMKNLDEEDMNFVKKFILASGSLKELAKEYEVTYPTIRLRLDRLIQKVEVGDEGRRDSYIDLIKDLALSEKIDLQTASLLINQYEKAKEQS